MDRFKSELGRHENNNTGSKSGLDSQWEEVAKAEDWSLDQRDICARVQAGSVPLQALSGEWTLGNRRIQETDIPFVANLVRPEVKASLMQRTPRLFEEPLEHERPNSDELYTFQGPEKTRASLREFAETLGERALQEEWTPEKCMQAVAAMRGEYIHHRSSRHFFRPGYGPKTSPGTGWAGQFREHSSNSYTFAGVPILRDEDSPDSVKELTEWARSLGRLIDIHERMGMLSEQRVLREPLQIEVQLDNPIKFTLGGNKIGKFPIHANKLKEAFPKIQEVLEKHGRNVSSIRFKNAEGVEAVLVPGMQRADAGNFESLSKLISGVFLNAENPAGVKEAKTKWFEWAAAQAQIPQNADLKKIRKMRHISEASPS